jgi:hypothetical protein
MLAHNQATLLNAAQLGRALGVDGRTVVRLSGSAAGARQRPGAHPPGARGCRRGAGLPRAAGASWEGTGGDAEIDLLLELPDGRLWAIEVKRSLSPRLGTVWIAGGRLPGTDDRTRPRSRHGAAALDSSRSLRSVAGGAGGPGASAVERPFSSAGDSSPPGRRSGVRG